MDKFYIDENNIRSVTVYESGNSYANKPDITPDEFFKLLKGEGAWSMTSSVDHPEFAALREQLGAEGYIRIERSWHNGDRVLKEFMLNDCVFREGEKFSSACALSHTMKYKKKDSKYYNY